MNKRTWWKKVALLCGMAAVLPFCMGISLMPTPEASPAPEVSQKESGDALTFTVPEAEEQERVPKPEVPFPDTQLPEFFWELPDPQEPAPYIPVE